MIGQSMQKLQPRERNLCQIKGFTKYAMASLDYPIDTTQNTQHNTTQKDTKFIYIF